MGDTRRQTKARHLIQLVPKIRALRPSHGGGGDAESNLPSNKQQEYALVYAEQAISIVREPQDTTSVQATYHTFLGSLHKQRLHDVRLRHTSAPCWGPSIITEWAADSSMQERGHGEGTRRRCKLIDRMLLLWAAACYSSYDCTLSRPKDCRARHFSNLASQISNPDPTFSLPRDLLN